MDPQSLARFINHGDCEIAFQNTAQRAWPCQPLLGNSLLLIILVQIQE
jgi:hypothetical protein